MKHTRALVDAGVLDTCIEDGHVNLSEALELAARAYAAGTSVAAQAIHEHPSAEIAIVRRYAGAYNMDEAWARQQIGL